MRKKRLGEIDEIAVRKRFLEEMNRAEAGRLLAMRGELRACEDDRARVRVARAQVVKKFLPKIRHGLDIEHEQVWFRVEHEPLRLIESRRDIDLG